MIGRAGLFNVWRFVRLLVVAGAHTISPTHHGRATPGHVRVR